MQKDGHGQLRYKFGLAVTQGQPRKQSVLEGQALQHCSPSTQAWKPPAASSICLGFPNPPNIVGPKSFSNHHLPSTLYTLRLSGP